jgi:DNA-directed RNA polymerase alpha subunit
MLLSRMIQLLSQLQSTRPGSHVFIETITMGVVGKHRYSVDEVGSIVSNAGSPHVLLTAIPSFDLDDPITSTPLNEFEMSVLTRNALASNEIDTLGQLTGKTESQLRRLEFGRHLGECSIQEIKEILESKGLTLFPED